MEDAAGERRTRMAEATKPVPTTRFLIFKSEPPFRALVLVGEVVARSADEARRAYYKTLEADTSGYYAAVSENACQFEERKTEKVERVRTGKVAIPLFEPEQDGPVDQGEPVDLDLSVEDAVPDAEAPEPIPDDHPSLLA